MKSIRKILMLIFLSAFISACSVIQNLTSNLTKPTNNTPKAVAIDSIRGMQPAGLKDYNININKLEYNQALVSKDSSNSARLVEIYQRNKVSQDLKEYRLLDVKDGSVYDLLGLKSKDIIIAADGYVVPTAYAFWNYVILAGKLGSAKIEIQRDEQPMMIVARIQ